MYHILTSVLQHKNHLLHGYTCGQKYAIIAIFQ
jgi:hypothetical protein